VDEATTFADHSPFPDLDSLYDDVYVYSGDVPGWWTVDERSPEVHPGEKERDAGPVPHELAEQGAAYASVGDAEARRRGSSPKEGEGEPAADDRDEEGGGD